MKLFNLSYGKSKKRMSVIMTDSFEKCQNYKKAREGSSVKGWHEIAPAASGATVWRKKSCTIGGNSVTVVPRVGKGFNGYVSKHGFQPHT